MQLLALNTFGGIPAHPLLVHIPVMMIPLALALTVLALWGRVRTPALWGATGAAFIGLIGCFLASGSGEALQNAVERTELLHEHTEAGEAVAAFVVPYLVVLLVVLLIHLARNEALPFGLKLPKLRTLGAGAATGLLVLSTVLGAVASWKTYDAGHSGAKSAWNDIDLSKVTEGHGEGDDD